MRITVFFNDKNIPVRVAMCTDVIGLIWDSTIPEIFRNFSNALTITRFFYYFQ